MFNLERFLFGFFLGFPFSFVAEMNNLMCQIKSISFSCKFKCKCAFFWVIADASNEIKCLSKSLVWLRKLFANTHKSFRWNSFLVLNKSIFLSLKYHCKGKKKNYELERLLLTEKVFSVATGWFQNDVFITILELCSPCRVRCRFCRHADVILKNLLLGSRRKP